MIVVPVLAIWVVMTTLSCGLLWGARSLAPRVAEGRDYSLVRHVLWLLPAGTGAVLMFAAASVWVFLPIAGCVLALLFFRAALDAQAGERQRIAFVEMYAGYLLVAFGMLIVQGYASGLRASPAFAERLSDLVAHFALPAQWLAFGTSGALPAYAMPETVALRVADMLASHLGAATAAASFGLAWMSLAYVSRRMLPEPGLPLMPLPALTALLFLVAWLMTRLLSGTPERIGEVGVALLWPPVAAEGIAIIRAAGYRFRSRRLLAVLLVLLLPLLPRLWGFLAFVGVLSGILWLRALVPPLRAGDGTAWHPTLSAGVRAAAVIFAIAAGLGLADRVHAVQQGALIGAPPASCGQVTMSPDGPRVAFASPWASFAVDAVDGVATLDGAASGPEAACRARGARLCTSDEWYLACLCTYPAESSGGPQISGNPLLAHRVRQEAGAGDGRRSDDARLVKRLFEGPAEAVVSAKGELLYAGGEGPDGPAWFTDCRHRRLARAPGEVGVRCCR